MNIIKLPASSQQITDNALTTELSDYGLRPEDWAISQIGPFHYQIENKQEPSFCFQGKVLLQNGKKTWKAIQLASL